MFSVNAYDLHRAFSVFAESQIISDEIRKKDLVAQDLGIDLRILDIPAENATEEIALKQSIVEWCQETWGQDRYSTRKIAAKEILECYQNRKIKLDLADLDIGSLPENFHLPHLERLYLECCYINSWPKSFNLNNLKKLVLNGNFLGSIFEILNNHPNLESLALDENELENLPENLKFPKLQFLSLNRNWITTLPTSWNMPELKELSLTENELTSLPEYFSYPKLTRLALTDNQNLRELPMSLAYCDRLVTIAVNETGISRETVKSILAKREELKFVERVATLLGEWNGRLDDDSDLRLPIEMIGEIAELGTLHGELNEYWIRSTSLAEEIELEILDERASSSSEFSGSRKRKRES